MKKLFFIVLTLTAAGGLLTLAETRSPKQDISRNLDIFNALYKELQTYYVDSIDAEKSITTAIAAMLDDIDPYTEYIPYSDQEEFTSMTISGEYAGVGSTIMERDGWVYFSGPMEGSPAAKAGVKAGDKIVMIDNDSTRGWPNAKVSQHLKGQAGTDVRVTVHRPYVEDSVITMTITRSKIFQPSVPYYGVIEDNLGYIALNQFIEKSPEEVKTALEALKKDKVKAYILDLRGNGGGLVESAVQILGYFLPKGTEVLRTRGRAVTNERVYKTTTKPIDTETPLVILVDGGTASAAEIVSGALQDLDRAVIVGNRSFGKGLVQSTRELPYDGLLKVTVSKYYIPSGRLIQAIDYSHRNPDGSVGRIPDSLTTVFHTAAGREVRDGGGITPDLKVEYPEVNRLTFNIVRNNWAFDYATKYAAAHPTIPEPGDFVIDDVIFEDFKDFIDPDTFQYDKVCEDGLKALREVAEREGYMNDSTEAAFSRLEALMKHDLNHDLDLSRSLIEPYLAGEIVGRYYYNRGEIQQQLKNDAAIDSVVKLLTTPGEYRRLLTPKK